MESGLELASCKPSSPASKLTPERTNAPIINLSSVNTNVELIFDNISAKIQSPLSQLLTPDNNKTQYSNSPQIDKNQHISHHTISKTHKIYNASGVISPGTMTLIVAPLGAGKTTLLRLLAQIDPKSSGSLYFNGYTPQQLENEYNIDSRRLVSYTGQDDMHIPLLTVNETLDYDDIMEQSRGFIHRTQLRTTRDGREGDDMSDSGNRQPALPYWDKKKIINILGLEEALHTRVSDLSGGQLRRLTLAESLLHPRPFMCLDQYTDGLDAARAETITIALKEYVKYHNISIIASLQQPTPTIIECFDRLILLSQGSIIYHGSIDNIIPFFTSYNLNCPYDVDLFDYILDCLSQDDIVFNQYDQNGNHTIDKADNYQHNDTDNRDISQEDHRNHPHTMLTVDSSSNKSISLLQHYKNTDYYHNMMNTIDKVRYNAIEYDNSRHKYNKHLSPSFSYPHINHTDTTNNTDNKYNIELTHFNGTGISKSISSTQNDAKSQYSPRKKMSPSPSSSLPSSSRLEDSSPPDEVDTSRITIDTNNNNDHYQYNRINTNSNYVPSSSLSLLRVNPCLNLYAHKVYSRYHPYSSLWYQFIYTLHNQFIQLSRNLDSILPRLFVAIVLSLFYGSVMWNIPPTNFYARLVSFLTITVQITFCNTIDIPILYNNSFIIKKHIQSQRLLSTSYSLSLYICSICVSICEAIVYSSILYFMNGNTHNNTTFWIYCFLIFCLALHSNQWYRLWASIGPPSTSSAIATTSTGIFMVISGLFSSERTMPKWSHFMLWISPLAWITRSLANNEFSSSRYDQLVVSITGDTRRMGDAFMIQMGMKVGSQWIWYGAIFLIATSLLLLIMHTLVIRASAKLQTSIGTRRTISVYNTNRDHEKHKNNKSQQITDSNNIMKDNIDDNNENNNDNRQHIDPLQHHAGGGGHHLLHQEKRQPLHTLCHSLPFTPMWMSWTNVSYTVMVPPKDLPVGLTQTFDHNNNNHQSIGSGIKRSGITRSAPRRLLNNVSGYAEPGKLIALMGASGAGKTTLLDVLAMRKSKGVVEGEIKINGQIPTQETLAASTGYVEQFPILFPYDTVQEALQFAAELSLPNSTPEIRHNVIDEVLDVLELTSMKHHKVGSPTSTCGLSVAQLKRVGIALELVGNPAILFLDEPTTGLDSASAVSLIRTVRRIAQSGRSVICTIHQPSSELFFLFDNLMLLGSGGWTIYFGPLGYRGKDVLHYMHTIPGVIPMPRHLNPATWILDQNNRLSRQPPQYALDMYNKAYNNDLRSPSIPNQHNNEEKGNDTEYNNNNNNNIHYEEKHNDNGANDLKIKNNITSITLSSLQPSTTRLSLFQMARYLSTVYSQSSQAAEMNANIGKLDSLSVVDNRPSRRRSQSSKPSVPNNSEPDRASPQPNNINVNFLSPEASTHLSTVPPIRKAAGTTTTMPTTPIPQDQHQTSNNAFQCPQTVSKLTKREHARIRRQFILLLKRNLSGYIRNPPLLIVRCFVSFLISVFFSIVDWKVDTSIHAGFIAKMSAIALCPVFLGVISSSSTLPLFFSSREVFYREHRSSWYNPLLWPISWILIEIPFSIIFSLCTSSFMYPMVGLKNDIISYIQYILSLILSTLNFVSLSLFCSIISPTSTIASVTLSAFYGLLISLCGTSITLPDIPSYWLWLSRIFPTLHISEMALMPQFDKNNTLINVLIQGQDMKIPLHVFAQSFLGFSYDRYWNQFGWAILIAITIIILSSLTAYKIVWSKK